MINFLKCMFGYHGRGKPTGETRSAGGNTIARSYKCPRCTATWTRKVKAA